MLSYVFFDLLDLKGMIVTIDAMGCQKKIVEKIAEKKSEYVILLRGNQQSIHNADRCSKGCFCNEGSLEHRK